MTVKKASTGTKITATIAAVSCLGVVGFAALTDFSGFEPLLFLSIICVAFLHASLLLFAILSTQNHPKTGVILISTFFTLFSAGLIMFSILGPTYLRTQKELGWIFIPLALAIMGLVIFRIKRYQNTGKY